MYVYLHILYIISAIRSIYSQIIDVFKLILVRPKRTFRFSWHTYKFFFFFFSLIALTKTTKIVNYIFVCGWCGCMSSKKIKNKKIIKVMSSKESRAALQKRKQHRSRTMKLNAFPRRDVQEKPKELMSCGNSANFKEKKLKKKKSTGLKSTHWTSVCEKQSRGATIFFFFLSNENFLELWAFSSHPKKNTKNKK